MRYSDEIGNNDSASKARRFDCTPVIRQKYSVSVYCIRKPVH